MRSKQTAGTHCYTREVSIHHFKDHTNTMYTVIGGRPSSCPNPDVIRKLSVHLYCLDTPSPNPEALGNALLASNNFGLDHQPRVDAYTSCSTIEQCMSHHLLEKAHRRRATEAFRSAAVQGMDPEQAYDHLTASIRGLQPLPHIAPSWCDSPTFWIEDTRAIEPASHYRSWILVLPRGTKTWSDVLDHGILLIEFDLFWSTSLETTFDPEDCDPEEPSELLNDARNPWIVVGRVPKPPDMEQTLLCVRERPMIAIDATNTYFNNDGSIDPVKYKTYEHGWETPGTQARLHEVWRHGFSRQLGQSMYANLACHGCAFPVEGVEHRKEECEWELSEQILDDDGQCVEDRRFWEYRRRSKRIAHRKRKAINIE